MTVRLDAPPRVDPPQAEPPTRRWRAPLSGLLVVAAIVLWALATQAINLDAMTSRGLISVVGARYFAALVLLAIAAGLELTRPRVSNWGLAAIAVALVVVLYGVLNVTEGEASLTTGWLHVGFSEYIETNGAVAKSFDARFSWPGFFAGAAVVAKMAGWDSPAPLMLWAPVVLNALAILPVFTIGRAISASRRIAWLGVLLYFCGNWFAQDYFAPQAVGFLLFISVLALLLAYRRPPDPVTDGPPAGATVVQRVVGYVSFRPQRRADVSAGQALALEAVLVLLIAGAVVTHQLTPVAMILTLIALTVLRGTRARGLWFAAVLIFLVWFSYGALDYWSGHLDSIIGSFGKVGATFESSVGTRVTRGNPTYQQMQSLRVVLAIVFCIGALLGVFRLRRKGSALLWLALGFSSFALVGLQSYGGEVAIRTMLFALPVLAPLTAVGIAPLLVLRRQIGIVTTAVVILAGGVAVTAARGANAGFERVPPDVVTANQILDNRLKPDQTLGSLQYYGVLGDRNIRVLRAIYFNEGQCVVNPVPCALDERPTYVIISSTEDTYGVLAWGKPKGWTRDVVRGLAASGQYRIIYDGKDAQLLERTDVTP